MSGYRPQSRDTSEAADRLLMDAYRRMPPWEKARRVSDLTRACQELALAGIRERHPDADERELRLRLAALWLDRDTMIRVFSWDPEKEGYG